MAVRWFPAAKHLTITNAVTTATAVAAFAALALAAGGQIRWSLTLLALAITTDRLDGIVARRLRSGSDFGGELDSLADGLAFCVLPAFLALRLGAGLLVPLAFVAAGFWRLAHYNTTGLSGEARYPYYTGLPTTVIAAWLLTLAPAWLRLPAGAREGVLLAFMLAGAVLMVSGVRYPKEGTASRMFYVLIPLALVALWVF